MSVPVLSPSLYLSGLARFFLFVFLYGFFLRLSLTQILALVILSFYHFDGSFHFWAHLWGLFLGLYPLAIHLLSTGFSLMLFSPFFYLACGFFLFWLLLFSVLFTLGRHRAPFSLLLCATFSSFSPHFLFAGPFSTQLFPQVLVQFSPVCWAWIHWLFSFFT